MHGALLIPEVVLEVMGHLHPRTASCRKEMRATLLNAALTCSPLSGPALDVLWHTMDDLIPPNFKPSLDSNVVGVLPAALMSDWIFTSLQPSNIWGRIQEEHIPTFNAYAQRIRHYEPQTINNIDISAFSCILQSCGRPFLLPNLIYFKPLKISPDDVFFLLCPRLQELFSPSPPSPRGPRGNPNLIVTSFQSMSPNLVVLKLQYVVLDHHCLSAFCILTRLEKLIVQDASSETTPATLSFLFNMSAQHTLHHLELEGDDLEIVPSSMASTANYKLEPILFSALEHIEIECAMTIESMATLLHNARFPALEVFKIGLRKVVNEPHPPGTQEHWHQVFDNLSRTTTDSLGVLEFSGSLDELGSSLGFHLFDLPKVDILCLTSFALDDVGFDFDHRDVTIVVDAWPLLTSLTLQHFDGIPDMDFSVLITIARGLPFLQYLSISIDAIDHPGLEEIPLLCHALHSLTLCNSPVDDAKLVARSLDRLFPKLQVWDFFGGIWELWEEVDLLLEMLHEVRKEDVIRLGMSGDLTL